MMVVGILVIFAGYSVTSYGYVLIRGWNIPFKQWMSPLNPYLWPSGDPGTVPAGQIFPSQANSEVAGEGSAGPAIQPTAQLTSSGIPTPATGVSVNNQRRING